MSNCRLVALQGAAFRCQCRIDALVDGGLALAQASVLTALRLVVGLSRLQLGAHLLDLSHERCNGVMRGIAFNAQRLHFLGRELTARTRSARTRRIAHGDRKSKSMNSSHSCAIRMPATACKKK